MRMAAFIGAEGDWRLKADEQILFPRRYGLLDKLHTKSGKRMRLRFNRSEEHTSELQSLMRISYAVFCLKKKSTFRMIITLHAKTPNPNSHYTHHILPSLIHQYN